MTGAAAQPAFQKRAAGGSRRTASREQHFVLLQRQQRVLGADHEFGVQADIVERSSRSRRAQAIGQRLEGPAAVALGEGAVVDVRQQAPCASPLRQPAVRIALADGEDREDASGTATSTTAMADQRRVGEMVEGARAGPSRPRGRAGTSRG